QDSFHRRGQAEPHLQRQREQQAQQQDTQNRSGALLNQIAQESVMNPAKGSPMDPNQPGPAIQNLSEPSAPTQGAPEQGAPQPPQPQGGM
ncbi:hypothetical protein, partial [Herbiconiux daphne]